MIDLEQILANHPENLRPYKRNIVREYLQYKILDLIYSSRFGTALTFMGGTAVHILHGSRRFSEDLDFDDRGIGTDRIRDLAEHLKKNLELEGIIAGTKLSAKRASHIHMKFTDILQAYGLTAHKNETLIISIDMEPQNYRYNPAEHIINKYGVFRALKAAPANLLLAQKFSAILGRKRAMGRDFFDVLHLSSLAQPDFRYLKAKHNLGDMKALKTAVESRCANLNMKNIAKETAPFLFNSADSDRIVMFLQWLRQWDG